MPLYEEHPTLAPPASRPAASIAEEMLELRIAELDLRSSTLEEAIEKIGQSAHANIVVHWSHLEPWKIKRTSEINLHLWNVSVRSALRVIMDMEDEKGYCSFEPDGDVIIVSDTEELKRYTVVVAYNVRDILKAVHDPAALPPNSVPDSIAKVIEDSVDADTWREAGGSVGSIAELGGILVIRQTPANQRKIAALLEEIREGTRRLPTTRAFAGN